MIFSRSIGLCFLMGFLLVHGTVQAREACASPDVRLTLSARQIGVGVGYLWGHGTLSEGGQTYRFTVRGGGMLSLGGMTLSGQGCARNLARLQDFNGTYWTVGGTATIHHGTAGIVMENARGVDIHLHANTRGAQLSGQVSRLSFHLTAPSDHIPKGTTVASYVR
ncbi:hypothetical protein [Novacetimonas cocois]|nr:hypothetical protein [Novacetimonas cocois]